MAGQAGRADHDQGPVITQARVRGGATITAVVATVRAAQVVVVRAADEGAAEAVAGIAEI